MSPKNLKLCNMFSAKALQPESNAQFLLCVAISVWSVFVCACPAQVLPGCSFSHFSFFGCSKSWRVVLSGAVRESVSSQGVPAVANPPLLPTRLPPSLLAEHVRDCKCVCRLCTSEVWSQMMKHPRCSGLHGGNPALPSFPTVLLDDPPRGDAESWNKSA